VRREPAVMTARADALDAETTIVSIAGEVTFSNVNGLGRELAAALQAGARNLVVDLREVAFIDSSGLSALLTANAHARERGGAVALVHGAEPPSIFRFRGVERLLSLYRSRDDALAGLRHKVQRGRSDPGP
jgi:anti-sigma B factor antagonist